MTARMPLGADTAWLQAVDSHLSFNRRRAGILDAFAHVTPPDPDSKRQFSEVVDIFLDTPTVMLALPLSQLGHLGPLGALVAQEMKTLPRGVEQVEMGREHGIEYFRQFLHLVLRDPDFRRRTARWAWFQFLDPDVLLGYADRMAVSKDRRFVKATMREEFEEAFAGLAQLDQRDIAEETRKELHEAGHHPAQLRDLIPILRAAGANRAEAIASDLADEMDGWATLPRRFNLGNTYAHVLFTLAYAGSVCRRGWQYGELFTRQHACGRVCYLPQKLRADFMQLADSGTAVRESGPVRVYWWSWGSVLATAISQRPHHWDLGRIQRLLTDLRSVAGQLPPISVDEVPSPDALSDMYKKAASTLTQAAYSVGLVVADEARYDPYRTWGPAVARAIPRVGIDAAAAALGALAGPEAAAGLVVAAEAAQALVRPRLERCIDQSREYLEDKYLYFSRAGLRRVLSGGSISDDSPVGPIATRGAWRTVGRAA